MSSSTPVIIDNVSSLVTRYHSYTELCRWLHQIGSDNSSATHTLSCQDQLALAVIISNDVPSCMMVSPPPGQQCPTVCSLLHADLHDDHVISALHHIMSSVIQVEPVKLLQYPTSRCCSTGSCILTHHRKSGKLIKKVK